MNISGIAKDLMGALDKDVLTPYGSVPNSPETPAAYVQLPTRCYDFSSGGGCTMDISVVVIVDRADEETAQQRLGDLLNFDLIRRLITARSDYWFDVAFSSINSFRRAEYGNTACLAADVNLQLRTT